MQNKERVEKNDTVGLRKPTVNNKKEEKKNEKRRKRKENANGKC